jgi:hypothetical protein
MTRSRFSRLYLSESLERRPVSSQRGVCLRSRLQHRARVLPVRALAEPFDDRLQPRLVDEPEIEGDFLRRPRSRNTARLPRQRPRVPAASFRCPTVRSAARPWGCGRPAESPGFRASKAQSGPCTIAIRNDGNTSAPAVRSAQIATVPERRGKSGKSTRRRVRVFQISTHLEQRFLPKKRESGRELGAFASNQALAQLSVKTPPARSCRWRGRT